MNEGFLGTDRYRLIRRLATGGMGEVLLADFVGDDQVTNGLVVMKRNLPNVPQRDHQNKMLREEGRIAIRLQHANLVETFFIDEAPGEPLLVMEYLAGRSMAQVLGAAKKKKELVPLDVCLAVLRLSACGLHFAHTLQDRGRPLGLVHRDVSPANIFVTFDGKVKVIDFGVAKADDSEIRTSTGILKGKIGYMAPEHALGEKLTAQADLWSLGVLLWESLVAERLFLGQNPSVTLYQITTKPLDAPSKLRPDVPPHIDALCMRLLERDLSRRVRSCAELVDLIDRLPEGRALPQLDLGGFLSQRFEQDAAQGREEVAHAARSRRRTPIPAGLVDGAAPSLPVDDNVATVMLDRSELLALTAKAAIGATEDIVVPEEDLRTMRLAYPLDTLEEGPKPEEDVPTKVLPARDAPTKVVYPPPASLSVLSTATVTSSSQPTRTATSARRGLAGAPPAVAVAATTFGALALAMGLAFAALAARRAGDAPPMLFAYRAPAGHDVVLGAVDDAPAGVAKGSVRQLESPDPMLWKAGDARARIVPSKELMPRLTESGVLARARQPKTDRALVSAALPVAIALMGLLALALALPALLWRASEAKSRAAAVLLAFTVVVAAVWVARFGGLGWPGTSSLKSEAPPHLEWR